MRRFNGVFWLALTTAVAGCQQPFFMTELDYAYYNDVSTSYGHGKYEGIPEVSQIQPRDVTNPDAQEQWRLTLEEAKRIALQNNKQIAFLGYQPAEQGTQIDAALARFDAFISAGAGWARTDRQVANNFQTFGTGQNAVTSDLFGDSIFGGVSGAGFNGVSATSGGAAQEPTSIPSNDVFSISKRNAAGGLTSLTYSFSYSRQEPASSFLLLNPSWGSDLNLRIEQPLLQGAGVEFNRAPILIARAQHEQSIKTFEVSVHTLLRDLEQAYWQLYFTYQDLYSRETGMRQALATWQKEKNKQEVGTAAIPDVAQAGEQYQFFRAERLQALGRVQAAERTLRELMGLPPEDGRRIIPETSPTVAAFDPDWQLAVVEAMDKRPDIVAQRFAVRASELNLLREKNGLLPDLTVAANWRITGLDNQYDQSIDRLTDNDFTEWGLAVRYRRQIGERAAHAATRNAQLALSRERHTLRNIEHTVIHDLHEAYQDIITQYQLIQAQKDRREFATQQLESQEQFYRQGKTTIDVLLQAQTTFADALRDENLAIVAYNQALVAWEFAKGSILENDNVTLAEQQISLADDDLREQRWKQWIKSLPIPIHHGTKVHKQFEECPDNSLPLYPIGVLETPEQEPAKLSEPQAAPQPGALPDPKHEEMPAPTPSMLKEPVAEPAPLNPASLPPRNSTQPAEPEPIQEASAPIEFRPLPVAE